MEVLSDFWLELYSLDQTIILFWRHLFPLLVKMYVSNYKVFLSKLRSHFTCKCECISQDRLGFAVVTQQQQSPPPKTSIDE